MNFTSVFIETVSEKTDDLVSRLSDVGITGFEIVDKNDFLEFLEGTELYWDYVDEDLKKEKEKDICGVRFYLSETDQGKDYLCIVKEILCELKKTGEYGTLSLTAHTVNEEDWANNWKQYFNPIPIGDKLIIKPSWCECDTAGRVVLEIDPKSSFGTGQHETTCLCLKYLEKYTHSGENVLDMGCGSGILSIAALLLGASKALAVDIDENAVITARENAEINGVANRYTATSGNSLEGELRKKVEAESYDIICANIVADVIIAFLPLFEKVLKKGGMLLLSGIIDKRLSDVEEALENYSFITEEITTDRGWCAIRLTK